MNSIEIKARKMDLMETLLQLDSDNLFKVEHYIHRLLKNKQTTYEMSSETFNKLLDKAEEYRSNGNYLEEDEMNHFIDNLK